jgi:hypothetical protein
MKKFFALAVISLAASFSMSTGSASAYATYCKTWRTVYGVQTGYVRCTGGSGGYRAKVWCSLYDDGAYGVYRYGAWVGVGNTSSAKCTTNEPLVFRIYIERAG